MSSKQRKAKEKERFQDRVEKRATPRVDWTTLGTVKEIRKNYPEIMRTLGFGEGSIKSAKKELEKRKNDKEFLSLFGIGITSQITDREVRLGLVDKLTKMNSKASNNKFIHVLGEIEREIIRERIAGPKKERLLKARAQEEKIIARQKEVYEQQLHIEYEAAFYLLRSGECKNIKEIEEKIGKLRPITKKALKAQEH